MDKKAFGGRLKKTIKSSGYTIKDVARETGLSPAGISVMISGKSDPRLSSVTALSGLLGVSIDWLATGTDDPRLMKDVERLERLVDLINRLPD